MKKLFLLTVFFTIMVFSQEKNQQKDQDKTQDRVMLVDGEVLQIRDRDQIRLQDKITLNDGTIVNPDGTYQNKEGKQLRLKNGECLDINGEKFTNEYQYRQRINKENVGLTENQLQEKNQSRVQLMCIEGEVYQIRNQSQNRLKEKLTLGTDVVVNPDGTYQKQNQKQNRLSEGECLNMNGEMFQNTYTFRKMQIQKNNKSPKKGQPKPAMNKNKKMN